MKNLLDNFHIGALDIARLNYGVITLVPKCKDAKQIKKFRPICLLNVSLKILTKVLMNGMAQVAEQVISLAQTAFIRNTYIMEGALMLHETLNNVNQNKNSGILFEVDFEKAYDKIK